MNDTPPMPNVYTDDGVQDFIGTLQSIHDAQQALSQGIASDRFDWTEPATDESRAFNLGVMEQWRAEVDERRNIKRRNRSTKRSISEDRKRTIATDILDNVRRALSDVPEGERDARTRDAIYDLGKFVNEGYLSEPEVSGAILRAAEMNGLADDRSNGRTAKIKRDIPRGLAKVKRDGITVDWTRFDWLYLDDEKPGATGDPDESGSSTDEFDEYEDTTPVLASGLLTRSDLLLLPDPEPLIDNVLDQGTTALLYGKWGTLKTFMAFDWAASVATGRPWQGRATATRRVLYVVGEGVSGFKGRVTAWESGWRRSIDDEALSILPTAVNLTRPIDVANLRALIEWGGYAFIILDTLARCMVGADENSAKDCGVVVDSLTRLRDATPEGRGVVLGVHHAGKDGKTLRGSSAFEAGADTVYFASRDERIISLSREKRKDGPEADHHLLEFDPTPGTGSGTVKASHGLSHGGETGERTATLRLIMSQHFSLTGATATQLQRIAVEDGPMTRPTYYRALSDLLESKWLINTGSDKRPFYFIT